MPMLMLNTLALLVDQWTPYTYAVLQFGICT